jgi:phage gp45-like
LNAIGDASFSGNVTIGGRLFISANSIYANSIMGSSVSTGTFSTTSDLSLNTRLFVGPDVSFNANLYVKGNVRFDGSVNFAANSISTDSIQMGVNNNFGMFQYSYVGKTLYDFDSNRFLITRYIVDSETRNVIYSNTHLTINGNITSMFDMSVNRNLSVAGNISISGRSTATGFTTASDYRIKANIQSLIDTSFNVDLLKPVTYINKKLNIQDIGFIAHEVQEQIPFLVTGEKDGEEFQSLNYTAIIGILTKEIQELKREMKEMRTELALLKK